MKIIDSHTPAPLVQMSMLLHGETGGGKSHWSTTGGNPLAILTELKAMSTLRKLNPHAVGIVPESLKDLLTIFELLGLPEKLAARGIDRIVLDSYTDLTYSLPRWIKEDSVGTASILNKLDQSEFGNLRDYGIALVRAIQLTGYPNIIINRSISKRIGLIEKIVPDGMGKSVNELPGKLLPTAEARFDDTLGFVIDTTRAEYSQRCGVPWLPPVWQGSCLDYIRLFEEGSREIEPEMTSDSSQGQLSESAKIVENPKPEPPAEWVSAMAELAAVTLAVGLNQAKRQEVIDAWDHNGPEALESLRKVVAGFKAKVPPPIDPKKNPEGYNAAFGAMTQEMQAEKIAKAKETLPSDAAVSFVEGLAPAGTNHISDSQWLDFQTLLNDHNVSTDALETYCQQHGYLGELKPNRRSLGWITPDYYGRLVPMLTDANKRRTLNAHLKNL